MYRQYFKDNADVHGMDLSLIQPASYVPVDFLQEDEGAGLIFGQDTRECELFAKRYRITVVWHGYGCLGFDTHADAQWEYFFMARNLLQDIQVSFSGFFYGSN